MLVQTPPLKLAMPPGDLGPDDHASPDPTQRSLFAAARKRPSTKGHDGVWSEMPSSELAGCICIFDPATLEISVVIHFPRTGIRQIGRQHTGFG